MKRVLAGRRGNTMRMYAFPPVPLPPSPNTHSPPQNTNVVRFFSLLRKDCCDEQLCYYQVRPAFLMQLQPSLDIASGRRRDDPPTGRMGTCGGMAREDT